MRSDGDPIGGGVVAALGIAASVAAMRYKIGTLTHIGPGFFPAAVGGLLAVVGLIIMFSGRKPVRDEGAADFRGWVCILGSLVAFIVLGKFGGLVPASFATAIISALGSRKATLTGALTLSIALTAVTVVTFGYFLQINFPLFRWGS